MSKTVRLNDFGEWVLYRGLACHFLEQFGLTPDILGCSYWEYTSAFDMSFEETRVLDLALWSSAIAKDIEDLKRDLVKQH